MKPILILFCCLSFGALASQKTNLVMQTLLDRYIEQGDPGCVIAYGNKDQTFYLSKGVEHVSNDKLITEDTRFLTASLSKQFTAHLALLLSEKGKLNLNSKLRNELPDIPISNQVTAAQLMNHTSGIADHWAVFEAKGKSLNDNYQQADAVSLLNNNAFLEFKPGTAYSYSNGGYVALTQAIEQASSTSLNKSIFTNVFKELGIKAQYLDNPNNMPVDLVHGHMKTREGQFNYKQYDSYIYGPGNLMITAKELATWARYLNRYLSADSGQFESVERSNFNYVAGLFVDQDGKGTPYYHHGGYYEHASQDIVLIPSQNEFSAVLCNRSDFRPAKISRGILEELNSLYPMQHKVETITKPNDIQTGFYSNSSNTKAALLFEEEGELFYYGELVGSPKKLKRLSNDLWVAELSASNVFIEQAGKGRVIARNEQKEYELTQLSNQHKKIERVESVVFTNNLIGNIRVSLGETSSIEFLSGLGKFPLTCYEGKICLAEYGYIALNLQLPSSLILSTHDIENLTFTRQSQ